MEHKYRSKKMNNKFLKKTNLIKSLFFLFLGIWSVSAKAQCSPDIDPNYSNCTGDSIQITAASGFNYSWSNGATTQSIWVTSSDSIWVVITDSICQPDSSSFFSPTSVSILNVNLSPEDTTLCANESLILSVNAISNILWSTGDTANNILITPLSNTLTVYYVDVTENGSSCRDSVNITVLPEVIINTIAVNNTSSQNACDGQISPSASGIMPLNYQWNIGAFILPNTIGGVIDSLCENTYCLTITDANNCSVDTCVNVEWNPCNLNLTISNPILCNGETASVNVVVDTTAGIGPFIFANPRFEYSIYSLNPLNLIQFQPFGLSLFTFNNPLIVAGDYLVTVYDKSWQDSCSSTITISEPDPILIYTSIDSTSAPWIQDGVIAIDSITGGTLGYNITWLDSVLIPLPTFGNLVQDSLGYSNQYNGGYTINVTDTNGCSVDTIVYVHPKNAGDSLFFESISVIQPTCFQSCDAFLVASISGVGTLAVPPFTFKWYNLLTGVLLKTDSCSYDSLSMSFVCSPFYNTDHVGRFNNRCAGVYSLQAYDYYGNAFSDQEFVVIDPDSIYVQLVPDFVIPCGEDTVLSSLVVGGNTLNDTLLISTQTLNLNNLGTGFTENLIVGKDYLMVVSGTYTEIATGNTFDAAYDYTTIPAIPTIPMNWVMDGNTTHRPTPDLYQATHSYNFPFVGTGTHNFGIMSSGFTGNLTFQLYEITLDTSIYTYAWTTDPPGGPNPPVISDADTALAYPGVSGTDYILTVADANGCEAKDTVNVSWDLYILNFDSIGVSNAICNGDSTGYISVIHDSTTGFTPYTIFMDGFATTTPTPLLPAGSYTINIQDSVGCLSQDSVVIITQPDSLYACGIDTVMVSILVDAFTMDFDTITVPYSYTTVLTQLGLEYKLVVSGTYTDEWNILPQIGTKDAAYQFNDISGTLLSPPLAINEWGWNGTSTARPTPDVYDPTTHTYEYYFVGDSANQVFTYTDPTGNYLNNAGSLSFELYKMLCSTTDTAYTCFGDSTAIATVYPNGGVPFINNVGTSYYNVVWTDNSGAIWPGNTTVSGLPTGNFTATITDSLGCTYERGLVVLQSATALQIDSLAQTNVMCKGDSTGLIYAVVSGGFTSNYVMLLQGIDTIFSLSGQLDTIQITGLPAGIYEFFVFDSIPDAQYGIYGCGQNVQITITEPQDYLSSTINLLSDVSCWGDSTGAAVANVIGGQFYYTYDWDNGETNNIATGLWAGWQAITFIDSNGCTLRDSIEIKNTNPKIRPFYVDLIGDTIWEIKFIEDSVSCFGVCDGEVSLETFGGVLPHTYVWDVNPNTIIYNQPDTVDGLCAGGHDVLVQDNIGCQQRIRFGIDKPNKLFAVASEVSPISCFGFNDGTAHAFGIGGNNVNNQQSAYTFNWFIDGLLYSTTDSLLGVGQNIDSLPPGIHVVQVTDYKGCVATDTVEIIEPTQLSVVIVDSLIVYAYCEFTKSASLCAQAFGGTPGYVYQWDDAYFQNNTSSALFENSPFCADNLTPFNINTINGNYNVIVIDERGCVASETIDIDTITNTFNSNTISVSVVDVTCFDGFNGSITISSITGGTPSYNFLWSGPPGFSQNIQNISSLVASSYAVIVTDSLGCQRTKNITVNEPDQLYYSIYNSIDETCTGDGSTPNSNGSCDGQIMVNVSGGTGNYYWDVTESNFFPITPANQVQIINDTLIKDLCSGVHNIYLTDDNDCEGQVLPGGIGTLTINTLVNVDVPGVNWTPNTCSYSTNGTAWMQFPGANPLFDYTWETTSAPTSIVGTGASISNLSIGNYVLVAQYANDASFGIFYPGCDATEPFTISGPLEIVPVATVTPVTCWGDNNGSINLAVSGGIPGYTYQWDNTVSLPSGATTASVNNLLAGTYGVTITDANGCDTTLAILITQPSQIQNDFTINDVICYGDASGSITPITSGGTPNYGYNWGPINPLAVPAGTYSVTIIDANGCSITDEAIVEEPNPLLLSLITNNNYGVSSTGLPYFISCNGANDGEVLAITTGGLEPYNYAWSDLQTTNPAVSLSVGSITLDVTDANGCPVTASTILTEPSIIIDNPTLSTNSYGYEVSCFGASDGWISLDPSGGVPKSNGSYSYNWSSSASLDSVSSGISAGSYSVSIEDANGCSYSFNYTLISPSEAFSATVSTLNYAGPAHPPVNVIFTDATVDAAGNQIPVNHNWYWTNYGAAEPFTNSGWQNFSHIFTEVGPNDVYVLVQNANSGCMDTVNFIIEVQGIDYTTNVFSPNGDGINDEFIFDKNGIKAVSVEIYNRWGSLVMNWTDLDKGWDGTGSDGQDLPDAVYFYVLTAEGEDGYFYENKSSITLIR